MDKWLSHPTVLKIVAVMLGILMWAVVHFDSEATPNTVASLTENKTINDVKVQAYGLDERNYVLRGLEPQTVELKVKGSRNDLRAGPDDYRLRIDLRTVGEGKHTIKIDWDLPRGIELVEMSPSTVTVEVEELQTKEFEVDVRTEGEPEAGYKAGTPIVKPSNRVHVTLPKNDMEVVDRVGATVSIKGQKETLKSKSVKLAAYDADGNVIEGAIIEPAVVEVEVPVTNPFKTVPLQFRFTGHMPAGLSIASFKPAAEQVTVYGPQDALDKLEFIEVTVEQDQLKNSGKITLPLSFEAPIIEIAPMEIDVNVEVVLSETRSLEGLPIVFQGLAEGLIAKITDPVTGKADIIVQGAPSILGSLKPGDVDVFADISGRGTGTYQIPLNVNLERFMEQAGGTSTITVEIAEDVPATVPPVEGETGTDPAAGDGSGTDTGTGGSPEEPVTDGGEQQPATTQ